MHGSLTLFKSRLFKRKASKQKCKLDFGSFRFIDTKSLSTNEYFMCHTHYIAQGCRLKIKMKMTHQAKGDQRGGQTIYLNDIASHNC